MAREVGESDTHALVNFSCSTGLHDPGLSSQGRNLPESVHGFLVLGADFHRVFINIYTYVHVTDYTNHILYF